MIIHIKSFRTIKKIWLRSVYTYTYPIICIYFHLFINIAHLKIKLYTANSFCFLIEFIKNDHFKINTNFEALNYTIIRLNYINFQSA